MAALRALTTIAIGDDYLRMALALMASAHRWKADIEDYIIYCDNVRPEAFVIPPYVTLKPCGRNRDLFPGSRFAPRMDKSTVVIDPDTQDKTVAFLDSDTIVCKPVLGEMFERIEAQTIMVHGRMCPENEAWMTRKVRTEKGEVTEEFNLRRKAADCGIDIPNFTLNGGIFGRTPSEAGIAFSRELDELLRKPPFEIWPGTDYLNDEPFIAIAFLNAMKKHGLEHKGLPREFYMGLANRDLMVVMTEAGEIDAAGARPGLVHFAGKYRRDTAIYMAYMQRFAPMASEAREILSQEMMAKEIFADLHPL